MTPPPQGKAAGSQNRTEIERKYLLTGLPDLPKHAEAWHLTQGYFVESEEGESSDGKISDLARLRHTEKPDGSVEFTLTHKRGYGLVRDETERIITEKEFNQWWPTTQGRRLNKIRHRVHVGEVVWEIDDIEDLKLVLAEVELSSPETSAPIPAWLQPHIAREVTDDPNFTNAALALQARTLR